MSIKKEIDKYVQSVSESAQNAPNIAGFLASVFQIISQAVQMDGVSIFLSDSTAERLSLVATTGSVGNHRRVVYRFGEGTTGQVAQNRKSITLEWTVDTPNLLLSDEFHELSPSEPLSFIAVPMTWHEGQFLGVMRTGVITN